LDLTGSYKRSLKAKVTRGNKEVDVDIVSDTKQSVFIEKNYNDIYGLDERQQNKIEADITRKIEEKVTNYLNR